MSRQWILVPAIIAVAIAALAFGITHYAVCRRPAISLDGLCDLSFLARKLELSDAQAGEIKRLHTTLGAKLDDFCTRHCAARARLGQALTADTNGSAQADNILAEMCRAYAQSERATLDHLQAVRAVLNADQRRRFDTMISVCMCQPCSMPGGHCGADAADMATSEPPQDANGRKRFQ